MLQQSLASKHCLGERSQTQDYLLYVSRTDKSEYRESKLELSPTSQNMSIREVQPLWECDFTSQPSVLGIISQLHNREPSRPLL